MSSKQRNALSNMIFRNHYKVDVYVLTTVYSQRPGASVPPQGRAKVNARLLRMHGGQMVYFIAP
jgi:hypothetical protein